MLMDRVWPNATQNTITMLSQLTQAAINLPKPMRVTRSMGKMIGFTKDGKIPLPNPTDPFFIVAPSLGSVPIVDRRGLATRRLMSIAQVKDIAISETKETTIHGLPGFELLANAVHANTGAPMRVFQVMLFPDGGGYILMIGLVNSEQAEPYLARFRETAQTFQLK